MEEYVRCISKIEEYDLQKLRKARRLIDEVYNYYYGFNPTRSQYKRLETILSKLDYLIESNERKD